ncbi:hypothetical protein Bca52824_017181 [Brassica carinata]|uniref:Protein kinase domain-containing protein n=1 Tax=Brassica carinata TaxID=52824 RepID=A0A8X7VMQ1_BRACI|nr:hypothetical protein Bca52824_017181 [Brassica carinata]
MKPVQSPPGLSAPVKSRPSRRRQDLSLPLPQRDVSLAVPLPLPPTSGGSSSSSSAAPSSTDPKIYSDLERGNRIGSGAGGTVYKVIHRPTSRVYALKVIYGNHEENVRRQICREIEILRDVSHPNIVRCHEMFDQNGEIQVLLEFMDKGSLEGRHVSNERDLAHLSRQILSGLAYLHGRHIVHRDIKPSNLLINSANIVKIADFGVSRILAQTMDPCNSSVGTIAYMSPERINTDLNQGRYDGYAGDIWSLGVSILEFFLGASRSSGDRVSGFSEFHLVLLAERAGEEDGESALKHPFILRAASQGQNRSPQNLHQLLPPPRPLSSSSTSSPTT